MLTSTMFTILKNLFNNGDNNGEILIRTKDKDIKCHEFIANFTSEFLKISIEKSDIVELDFSSELVIIVLNFLYSEKVTDKELNAFDIIQLFNLIGQLRCHQSIIILKNYYLKKFPALITELNWIELLSYVFNISKYDELQTELINCYTNNVLTNPTLCNLYINNGIDLDVQIKNLLFAISLKKINELSAEVLNLSTEKENKNKQDLNNYLNSVTGDSDDLDESIEEAKILSKPNSKFKSKTKK